MAVQMQDRTGTRAERRRAGKAAIAELRNALRARIPFMLGPNPDRVSPVHVLNGFIRTAFGSSRAGDRLTRFIGGDVNALRELTGEWDERDIQEFREVLSAVFDPDGNVFGPDFGGSPLPVHGALATNDPSDDGFGGLLWALINSVDDGSYSSRLEGLFFRTDASDPVTAIALILAKESLPPKAKQPSTMTSTTAWFADPANKAGRMAAEHYVAFLSRLTEAGDATKRLYQIQHLGRGLFLIATLATLYGPQLGAAQGDADTFDDFGPIVVFAGQPPGRNEEPIVQMAIRSFSLAVERHLEGIVKVLEQLVQEMPVPSQLPREYPRVLYAIEALEQQGTLRKDASKILSSFISVGRSGMGTTDIHEQCENLVHAVYSAASERNSFGWVASGLRQMGRKIGLTGPERGRGEPRFVAETPLLGTLVAGICGRQSMPFERFVTRVRRELGLYFGPGEDDYVVELRGVRQSLGMAYRYFKENEEALRARLVAAGLAKEYSDSHTEVLPNGF